MKVLILLTAVFALTYALSLSDSEEQQWQEFKIKYDKSYKSEEEENMRKKIFAQKLKGFEEHNKKYEEGLVSYKIGVNQFADITYEEFMKRLRPLDLSSITEGVPFVPPENVKVPKSIDWRKKGAVTRVKNQGFCESCYAFSVTGSLEGQIYRKTGKLVPLSEQNLIDCTRSYGNNGCHRGSPFKCFDYIKNNGGIDTESSYPYEGKDGKCRYNSKHSGGKSSGFVILPDGDEKALLSAVGTIGPIALGMNGAGFYNYTTGIIRKACDPNDITHAVLAVGYGTDKKGTDYWIIKNSWGEGFGEHGYARIIRNQNECGIASIGAYPIV